MAQGERIRALRKKLGLTQDEIASQLGMGRSNFGHIEHGRVVPSSVDLDKIADILRTNTEYLLCRSDDPSPNKGVDPYDFTPKEEKDIALKLQRMMHELENDTSLAFMGEPMDDEDRELLKISLENTLRMSKKMAKKKFTPNKYKN